MTRSHVGTIRETTRARRQICTTSATRSDTLLPCIVRNTPQRGPFQLRPPHMSQLPTKAPPSLSYMCSASVLPQAYHLMPLDVLRAITRSLPRFLPGLLALAQHSTAPKSPGRDAVTRVNEPATLCFSFGSSSSSLQRSRWLLSFLRRTTAAATVLLKTNPRQERPRRNHAATLP